MKTIILNAGIGSRLLPLTKNKPKCLIRINKKETILDWQLKSLTKYSLEEIIMIIGPFNDKIQDFIKNNYPNLNIQYVRNPIYDKTNYIYSLHLIKDFIDDNIILLHGDLIFSDLLLKKLLNSKDANCVLVNKEITPPEKDFKALIINDRIKRIGVKLSGPNTFLLEPLYKLTKHFFKLWINQIEIFVNNKRLDCYAEDALNEILHFLKLKPFYFNDLICMEIDDLEDLRIVKEILRRNKINEII